MPDTPDNFSDLLAPGEQVLAAIGGPGGAHSTEAAGRPVWWQLAFSHDRLLVVRMVQKHGGAWHPSDRFATAKSAISIARFPRTPQSDARIEIVGAEFPIDLIGIDAPTVFAQLGPFLQAFGGPIDGSGLVTMRADAEVYSMDQSLTADHKKLIVVVVVGFLFMGFCCAGGAVVSLVARMVLG